MDLLVASVVKANSIQRRLDSFDSGAGIAKPVSRVNPEQVVASGHKWVEGRTLDKCPNSWESLFKVFWYLGAEEFDFTLGSLSKPKQHANGCGLAGPVGT